MNNLTTGRAVNTQMAPEHTTAEATCLVLESTRQTKRLDRKNLQIHLQTALEDILSEPSNEDGVLKLELLLQDSRFKTLHDLIEEMKHWDTLTTIPEPKSFLFNAKLQPFLERMLKNIDDYRPYLVCLISRFGAVNEKIAPEMNTPLHYAVDALNISFVEWLLAQPDLDINSRNKQRKTALFLLCELYDAAVNSPRFKKRTLQTAKNPIQVGDIRKCILLLLEGGADFNVSSDRLKLPFELLMRNRSDENEQFMEQCVRKFGFGIAIGKTNQLKQRVVGFYRETGTVRVTVELLEIYLRFEDQDSFVREFERFRVDNRNVREVIILLLHTAVELDLEACVKRIVDSAGKKIFQVEKKRKSNLRRVCDPGNEVDANSSEMTHRLELKGLLKKACESGNVATLTLLLGNITDRVLINDDPILVFTLNRARELWKREEERDKVLECADLLANDQKVYLTRTDNNGNTALHSALKFGFTNIALTLLEQKYAFLGVRNKDNLTPLDYARYEFWSVYFDRCVSVDMRRSYYDRSEVRFNLNGFDPYIFKKERSKKSSPKDRSEPNLWRIVEKASASNVTHEHEQTFVTEMDPIKIISKSKDLKRLLIHPVVYTFILVKWLRLTKWSYLNLLCTLATVICFGWHSLDSCNGGGFSIPLMVLSFIGAIFMICREITQFLFLRFNYFLSFENYVDITTIILMLYVMFSGCNSIISSLTVIAFAMQLTVLIGSLPFNSLSIYMHMFQAVAVNFLKSFLLFIPLLGAFTFSFFLSYNDETVPRATPPDDNQFNNFGTFSDAALKTLVMTTGEFEAAAVDFGGGKIFIFALFIFFAPIVILNLINGLAVSDITAIKEEAELISITKKVLILDRYERGLRNIPFGLVRKAFPSAFFENHSYVVVVRPKEFRKILVQHITHSVEDHRGKRAPKGELRVVPNIPGGWFARGSEGLFINLRFVKFALFSTLDEHVMEQALRIADGNIMVKKFVHETSFELTANKNESLESEMKLDELKMEVEKMSRLLTRLVPQVTPSAVKVLPTRSKKQRVVKMPKIDEKPEEGDFRNVVGLTKAVVKFKRNKRKRFNKQS
ncbi:uncharacterized protein LOC129762260 [Toxorhynchites rutilus septentrionalis]|uniref:uncharacterized protein LOC129762260 n=1 Tax=Toxorhynchites rutilus septentrionalis TaxID=329112 RepID=UPI00247AAF6B|nr:uncharacterized protein LOC129762260 [Toxorhynchites rutilus septentrionalis]